MAVIQRPIKILNQGNEMDGWGEFFFFNFLNRILAVAAMPLECGRMQRVQAFSIIQNAARNL